MVNNCYCPRSIRALCSVCLSCFHDVAVGVGASAESDQSAPTQTAPQQPRFGSDWASIFLPWVWLLLSVCVLAISTTRDRTGRGHNMRNWTWLFVLKCSARYPYFLSSLSLSRRTFTIIISDLLEKPWKHKCRPFSPPIRVFIFCRA